MKPSTQRSLDELLADLPREIAPPRNLWRGISRRMDHAPRRARPMVYAAAAGLVCACVASAVTWAILHSHAPSPASQLATRLPNIEEPMNASYVAARDDLEMNFRQRLALLDPATRARIEASLAVIRSAHEDIRKALAGDPGSPVLERLWQSTWHDELDLYEHVVRATQPTMTRT
jgi:hypothetical protein